MCCKPNPLSFHTHLHFSFLLRSGVFISCFFSTEKPTQTSLLASFTCDFASLNNQFLQVLEARPPKHFVTSFWSIYKQGCGSCQGPAWHHLETTFTSRVMEIFPKSCSLQEFTGLSCLGVWSSPQSPHRSEGICLREYATYSTRDWIMSVKKSNLFWYGHSYKFIMLSRQCKRCNKLPVEHLWNSLTFYFPWQKDSTLQQPLSVHYKAGFMASQWCQVSSFSLALQGSGNELLQASCEEQVLTSSTCKWVQQWRRDDEVQSTAGCGPSEPMEDTLFWQQPVSQRSWV